MLTHDPRNIDLICPPTVNFLCSCFAVFVSSESVVSGLFSSLLCFPNLERNRDRAFSSSLLGLAVDPVPGTMFSSLDWVIPASLSAAEIIGAFAEPVLLVVRFMTPGSIELRCTGSVSAWRTWGTASSTSYVLGSWLLVRPNGFRESDQASRLAADFILSAECQSSLTTLVELGKFVCRKCRNCRI